MNTSPTHDTPHPLHRAAKGMYCLGVRIDTDGAPEPVYATRDIPLLRTAISATLDASNLTAIEAGKALFWIDSDAIVKDHQLNLNGTLIVRSLIEAEDLHEDVSALQILGPTLITGPLNHARDATPITEVPPTGILGTIIRDAANRSR